MPKLTTILVGCDLSEGSDQALARAIGIAELHQATIVLVHAQSDDAPLDDRLCPGAPGPGPGTRQALQPRNW